MSVKQRDHHPVYPNFLYIGAPKAGSSWIFEVLFEHPKVAEACAIGVPHEYRGETVKAYVVLKPGETSTEEEMIAYCKENLASYKVPKIIEFIDDLPKSAVGKILRKELRAMEDEKMKK